MVPRSGTYSSLLLWGLSDNEAGRKPALPVPIHPYCCGFCGCISSASRNLGGGVATVPTAALLRGLQWVSHRCPASRNSLKNIALLLLLLFLYLYCICYYYYFCCFCTVSATSSVLYLLLLQYCICYCLFFCFSFWYTDGVIPFTFLNDCMKLAAELYPSSSYMA